MRSLLFMVIIKHLVKLYPSVGKPLYMSLAAPLLFLNHSYCNCYYYYDNYYYTITVVQVSVAVTFI